MGGDRCPIRFAPGAKLNELVRRGGVEPPSLSAQAPHACVSAIPPPAHYKIINDNCKNLAVWKNLVPLDAQ